MNIILLRKELADMSKLGHKLLGLAAASAAVGAGVYYFLKKKGDDFEDEFADDFEDDFADDFEDDFTPTESSAREYVSLNKTTSEDCGSDEEPVESETESTEETETPTV